MNGTLHIALNRADEGFPTGGAGASGHNAQGAKNASPSMAWSVMDSVIERLAPCPWGAHAGVSPWGVQHSSWRAGEMPSRANSTLTSKSARGPLYTPEERTRRDNSRWTIVQGVLAPLQFLVCAVSLLLIARYLVTGNGYAVATASILLKTVTLYAIMITGCIWEKEVFGRWLFAPAFFWEDVFSMLVLALQTTYVVALLSGLGTPQQQMMIAVAAYATYAINAAQFLLKLRAARQDAAGRGGVAHDSPAMA